MASNPQRSISVSEAVRAEALATGYRRESYRQAPASIRGLVGPTAQFFMIDDRVREIAERLGMDEASRRLEADRKVATPSALIRTMRADWPKQSAAVARFAKREGLPLGEAWALLISEAVDRLGKRGRR